MSGTFFCEAHRVSATEFCVCRGNPVCLCAACISDKHSDKRLHDVFPMDFFELYRVLGNDTGKLKRRNQVVKKCKEFLDRATVREAAVLLEANALISDFVKSYQRWLERNHTCFNSLVELLKGEVALLMTTAEVKLSPLAQVLIERSQSLSGQEESLICSIPEKDALEQFTKYCKEALEKNPELHRREYADEVYQVLSKLPSEPQQIYVGELQESTAQIDQQKLIAVLPDEVRCFDIPTSNWYRLLALRRTSQWKRLLIPNIKIDVDHRSSSTFIAPSTIFVCGGGEVCTCHIDNNAYMLESDGCFHELPHMSTGRRCPGVVWDSSRKSIYVFGGFNDSGSKCYPGLSTSEMFLLNWSPLANMHQARRCFNPCWYFSLLYLCGGYIDSVETYDPRSNTFTLQNFTLPESKSATTAVVESGVLIVISGGYLSRLQQGRVTSQQHEEYRPWSNCTPQVSGGLLYIVDLFYNYCGCIDLTSGGLLKEVCLG